MRTTQDLMEFALRVIDHDLKTLGGVNSGVGLMGPAGLDRFVTLAGPDLAFRQSTAVKEVREARAEGWLDGVVHIDVGWTAPHRPGDTRRPSERPDCREVVFIFAYGEDGKSVAVLDVDRDDRGVRRGQLTDLTAAKHVNWLDQAFDSAPTGTA